MLGVVEVLTKLVVDFPVVDSENRCTQHDNYKTNLINIYVSLDIFSSNLTIVKFLGIKSIVWFLLCRLRSRK
jgi:hypothetical protein